LSFFDPIHNAIDAGFSGQFSQHQQRQEQGQGECFPFFLRPSRTCSNALYEAASMLNASAACGSPLSNRLAVHLRYFSLSFSKSVFRSSSCSKKWLTFAAFRVHQKALAAECHCLQGRSQYGKLK
jgi:hypothetical protein